MKVIDKIKPDVKKIGDYCSRHGTLFIAVDMLIDFREGGENRYLVCDITKDPAPSSYLPLMDYDRMRWYVARKHLVPTKVMADINAQAAIRYFNKL